MSSLATTLREFLRDLRAQKLRTTLTFLSILIAFMLFAFLGAIKEAFLSGVNMAGQDRLVHVGPRQAVGQVGADVADPVSGGNLLRLAQLAAHQRHHLDAVDQTDRVQVLGAERAGAGQRDLDRVAHHVFSRIRWPTAVFDAGTW